MHKPICLSNCVLEALHQVFFLLFELDYAFLMLLCLLEMSESLTRTLFLRTVNDISQFGHIILCHLFLSSIYILNPFVSHLIPGQLFGITHFILLTEKSILLVSGKDVL